MTSEEDRYLAIRLLNYHRSNELTEGYYFLEMSTLQATTLLLQETRIADSEIVAHDEDHKYLTKKFDTIGQFNHFFINNSGYYILNCEIKLENGTIINSHDDGEVSINFPIDQVDENLVDRIFENNNLDRSLIAKLKSRPGHYIAIDKNSNIIGDFKNFDDYVKNRNL